MNHLMKLHIMEIPRTYSKPVGILLMSRVVCMNKFMRTHFVPSSQNTPARLSLT